MCNGVGLSALGLARAEWTVLLSRWLQAMIVVCKHSESAREWRTALCKSNHHRHHVPVLCSV